MIDAHIPAGALQPDAERQLIADLTDILIEVEGFDPTSERARASTWVFLFRPQVFVGGAEPQLPRYRFVISMPEGQFDDERRAAVVKEMTEAVARAEGRSLSDVEARVWVFPIEIPDGGWGSRGVICRLPDIFALLLGEDARALGEARLANRRRASPLARVGS